MNQHSFFDYHDSTLDRIHDMGRAYEKIDQLLQCDLLQQSTSKHNPYWNSETESERLDDIRRSIANICDSLHEIREILDKKEYDI